MGITDPTFHRQKKRLRERANRERRIARLVDAIVEGAAKNVAAVGDKLRELEARLVDLEVEPDAHPRPVEWHSAAVDLYERKIADLQTALNADDLLRAEATSILRAQIGKILAYPAESRGQFNLELHGHLAEVRILGKLGNDGGGRETGFEPSPLPQHHEFVRYRAESSPPEPICSDSADLDRERTDPGAGQATGTLIPTVCIGP